MVSKEFTYFSSVNVTSSSAIHYIEIENENPYSEETMLHLAEDLVSTIQSSSQQEWLFLVGDGQTIDIRHRTG